MNLLLVKCNPDSEPPKAPETKSVPLTSIFQLLFAVFIYFFSFHIIITILWLPLPRLLLPPFWEGMCRRICADLVFCKEMKSFRSCAMYYRDLQKYLNLLNLVTFCNYATRNLWKMLWNNKSKKVWHAFAFPSLFQDCAAFSFFPSSYNSEQIPSSLSLVRDLSLHSMTLPPPRFISSLSYVILCQKWCLQKITTFFLRRRFKKKKTTTHFWGGKKAQDIVLGKW